MREDHIRSLVEADDPIREIWKFLVELWSSNGDLEAYFRQEDSVSRFERELNNLFFEVYDYLYRHIRRSHFKLELPLIILDGMSVREGNLLLRDLTETGYEIIEYSHSFSALPSETRTFRDFLDVKYLEVRSGRIPSEMDFRMPVWISYPDEILHHAARIIPPPQAYKKTTELLLQILRMVEAGPVTIISDHGYIMVDSVWALAAGDRRFLRERVFGSSRFVKRDDVDEKALRRLKKLPRDSYLLLDEEHCYIRGRYFWPIKGYGKVVAHGGLSLMECIVPRIKVRI